MYFLFFFSGTRTVAWGPQIFESDEVGSLQGLILLHYGKCVWRRKYMGEYVHKVVARISEVDQRGSVARARIHHKTQTPITPYSTDNNWRE